jgi:hypothetical protein
VLPGDPGRIDGDVQQLIERFLSHAGKLTEIRWTE